MSYGHIAGLVVIDTAADDQVAGVELNLIVMIEVLCSERDGKGDQSEDGHGAERSTARRAGERANHWKTSWGKRAWACGEWAIEMPRLTLAAGDEQAMKAVLKESWT